MSLAEVSRITRIPVGALSSIEGNQFDNLPGEVFVRGFLKAYAGSVGLDSAEIVARYTAHRRAPLAIPMPLAAPVQAASPKNRRVGVAVACVLLLVLFTLAVSIVMKPRGHDMPQDLSLNDAPALQAPRLSSSSPSSSSPSSSFSSDTVRFG